MELPQEIEIVSTFLEQDVGRNSAQILRLLDRVLSGTVSYLKINRLFCRLEVSESETLIYSNLSEDGVGNWCRVETDELRELVEIWGEEYKQMYF